MSDFKNVVLTAICVFLILFGLFIIVGGVANIIDELHKEKTMKWNEYAIMFLIAIVSIVFGVVEIMNIYCPQDTIIVDGYTYTLVTEGQPKEEISHNGHRYVLVEDE